MDNQEYMISRGIEEERREISEIFLLNTLYGKQLSFELIDELFDNDNRYTVLEIVDDFKRKFKLKLMGKEEIKQEDAREDAQQNAEFKVIEKITEYKNELTHLYNVRPLADIAQNALFINQRAAQKSDFYRTVESYLNIWQIPDKEILSQFYGEYADFVIKNLEQFNILRKTRSCDLPYTKHIFRVSVNSNAAGFDENSGKPANYYKTLWILHDSVEELPYSIRHENKIKYGIEGLPQFLNDFIPPVMHEDIMKVTNISDLILKFLDEKGYPMKTKQDMDRSLAALQKGEKYKYVFENVDRMREVLRSVEIKSGRDTFFEDAKWAFYDEIFLNDLAEDAYANNHYALFEGKSYDLVDNGIGRHARKLEDTRRAILKMGLWANKGELLSSKAKSKGISPSPFLDRTVVEVMNYANYCARDLLILYLSQPLSRIDHLRSALTTINLLKNILYLPNR